MIKKTMYFYDEKQANLIKKVNDKLHRQRGVKVGDGIDTSKAVRILLDAAEYIRMISQYNGMASELKTECRQVASQMVKLADKIKSVK